MSRGKRGSFVVLEGLDGAGTTTQAAAIARALRSLGYRVMVTQEPSKGPAGKLLRRALGGHPSLPSDTLALLFAADRTEHLAREVLPALSQGTSVICDRYLLSSLAYQGAVLPIEWVEEINARAPAPDLTLFLEVEVGTAARRRGARGGRAELFDSLDSQRRVAKTYLSAIQRRRRKERILRLDGGLPLEAVTRECLKALRHLFPWPQGGLP